MNFQYQLRRPTAPVTHKPPLLVLLHGKGANEEDLFALAPHFDARFMVISIRAPHEIAPGYYRWYERTEDAQSNSIFDVDEVEASRVYLTQAINDAHMALGTDPRQTYLFGFSQGAAMALAQAFSAPQHLRAAVAIAGRLLPSLLPLATHREAMRNMSLFIQHGTEDDVVPLIESASAVGFFAERCVKLGAKEYPAGHTITPGMLRDALAFLRVQLDDSLRDGLTH